MAIFNSYVSLPKGITCGAPPSGYLSGNVESPWPVPLGADPQRRQPAVRRTADGTAGAASDGDVDGDVENAGFVEDLWEIYGKSMGNLWNMVGKWRSNRRHQHSPSDLLLHRTVPISFHSLCFSRTRLGKSRFVNTQQSNQKSSKWVGLGSCKPIPLTTYRSCCKLYIYNFDNLKPN